MGAIDPTFFCPRENPHTLPLLLLGSGNIHTLGHEGRRDGAGSKRGEKEGQRPQSSVQFNLVRST